MPEMPVTKTSRKTSAGRFYPLGAHPSKDEANDGVNFALYSKHATAVYLLLFDKPDAPATDIIKIEDCDRYVWHVFVHGLKPGALYGFKVYGDFNPQVGARFNPNKLLMDPYAKALTGKFNNGNNILLGYDVNSADKDLSMDLRDSSAEAPKSIVIDDAFDWQGDVPPHVPLEKTIIYEVHLKGYTAHPSSKAANPGTYPGFIEKIGHLKELGITAVELLPIHEKYDDDFLKDRGLTNYWGYNTIGFFAPESTYGTKKRPGCEVSEFKTMVRELHKAGIEVILDVVYNHTAEGSQLGPTISLRGIDNQTYYALTGPAGSPGRYYINNTGCGNSLNLSNQQTIRLVMDSLRYWAEVMHVDGFRFDLASVLGMEAGRFTDNASFFDAVAQDPVLARVKLIAEPWDLGTYQAGNFPVDWSEWNGRFRDTMRRFAKGDAGQANDFGRRFTGSADLYGDDGRRAFNSINFITCHDGLTLCDLVSYNEKHNIENMENNGDGTNGNDSWNCGAEGATSSADVLALRARMAKNHVLNLLFSAGTPMILGGDEFLRTQKGNNNAYCQDNETSWFDWTLAKKNKDMTAFVRKAIAFTKTHPVLQARKFFSGGDNNANGLADISWYGKDLKAPDWGNPELRTLGILLDGTEGAFGKDEYCLYLIFNADYRMEYMKLPKLEKNARWSRVIDTSMPAGEDFLGQDELVLIEPSDYYLTNPRSTVLLLGKR